MSLDSQAIKPNVRIFTSNSLSHCDRLLSLLHEDPHHAWISYRLARTDLTTDRVAWDVFPSAYTVVNHYFRHSRRRRENERRDFHIFFDFRSRGSLLYCIAFPCILKGPRCLTRAHRSCNLASFLESLASGSHSQA